MFAGTTVDGNDTRGVLLVIGAVVVVVVVAAAVLSECMEGGATPLA
jgi:hypothetical protein